MKKQYAKKFPRKNINGVPNPKYVDMLEEDKPVPGQNFFCMSFCSPEKILKKKEIYFFEQFIKQWEFNKSMEKFMQFLNFISFKYNVSFDDINKDLEDFVKTEKEQLTTSIDDDYKTFIDRNDEELQKKFDVEHEFQTNIRGLKFCGAFPTQEECEMRCKLLREINPNHDIFVGPAGLWVPWDPEAYKTGRVEYMEEELNQLMHEKEKNQKNAKVEFETRVKEAKQKAIEENIKNAEKTGSALTQTVDKDGNLIGIGNAGVNTLEFGGEENTAHANIQDIHHALFEGDNIVTSKAGDLSSEQSEYNRKMLAKLSAAKKDD